MSNNRLESSRTAKAAKIMNKNTALKIFEYATAFFLLLFVAILISGYFEKNDFYSFCWLIVFGGLFSFTLVRWRQLHREIYPPSGESPAPPAPPALTAEEQARQNEIRERLWEEDKLLEIAAHELIVEMCRAKNIGLTLEQNGVSRGHYDIPELWAIEQPLLLTPEDLYAVMSNRVLSFDKKLHDNNRIYAHGFRRNGGWVSYAVSASQNDEK